jgi:hypothetical protein
MVLSKYLLIFCKGFVSSPMSTKRNTCQLELVFNHVSQHAPF